MAIHLSGLPGDCPSRAGGPPMSHAWPCSGWGLPSRSGHPDRWCALTAPFHPYLCGPEPAIGGLFSVALSCGSPRLAVSQHPALRSPDLPRPGPRRGATTAATRPAHRRHQCLPGHAPWNASGRPDHMPMQPSSLGCRSVELARNRRSAPVRRASAERRGPVHRRALRPGRGRPRPAFPAAARSGSAARSRASRTRPHRALLPRPGRPGDGRRAAGPGLEGQVLATTWGPIKAHAGPGGIDSSPAWWSSSAAGSTSTPPGPRSASSWPSWTSPPPRVEWRPSGRPCSSPRAEGLLGRNRRSGRPRCHSGSASWRARAPKGYSDFLGQLEASGFAFHVTGGPSRGPGERTLRSASPGRSRARGGPRDATSSCWSGAAVQRPTWWPSTPSPWLGRSPCGPSPCGRASAIPGTSRWPTSSPTATLSPRPNAGRSWPNGWGEWWEAIGWVPAALVGRRTVEVLGSRRAARRPGPGRLTSATRQQLLSAQPNGCWPGRPDRPGGHRWSLTEQSPRGSVPPPRPRSAPGTVAPGRRRISWRRLLAAYDVDRQLERATPSPSTTMAGSCAASRRGPRRGCSPASPTDDAQSVVEWRGRPGITWRGVDDRGERTNAGVVPVGELSYTEASRELDEIVAFFEQREVDVDQLVGRLERATAIVDELDRRLRQDPDPGRRAGAQRPRRRQGPAVTRRWRQESTKRRTGAPTTWSNDDAANRIADGRRVRRAPGCSDDAGPFPRDGRDGPPVLPPAALGPGLRPRGPGGPADGQFRLPDRRPRARGGAAGRSRLRVDDLLDVLAADDMRCVGVLGHPLPRRPRRRGSPDGRSRGRPPCSSGSQVPVHVQRDEVPWVERATGVGRRPPGRPRQRGRGEGGRRRGRAAPHPRPHARGASASWSRAGWSRGTPSSSTAAVGPTFRARTPWPCTSRSPPGWPGPRRHRGLPRPPLLGRPVGRRCRDPSQTTSSSAHARSSSGWPCSAGEPRARRPPWPARPRRRRRRRRRLVGRAPGRPGAAPGRLRRPAGAGRGRVPPPL